MTNAGWDLEISRFSSSSARAEHSLQTPTKIRSDFGPSCCRKDAGRTSFDPGFKSLRSCSASTSATVTGRSSGLMNNDLVATIAPRTQAAKSSMGTTALCTLPSALCPLPSAYHGNRTITRFRKMRTRNYEIFSLWARSLARSFSGSSCLFNSLNLDSESPRYITASSGRRVESLAK
jgi:hypothetical protein